MKRFSFKRTNVSIHNQMNEFKPVRSKYSLINSWGLLRMIFTTLGIFVQSVLFSQQVFDANFADFSFLQARRTLKVGTGTDAGSKALYTNVITIGSQVIDCIVTFESITNGALTLPGSAASGTTPFDYSSSTGIGMSANQDRYFAPTFDFNSGGGNGRFSFQFILGGVITIRPIQAHRSYFKMFI